MMKKLQKNRQSGITLVALVITIIVLIILAGVAINLTLGQNGLLNRTKEAREKYEIASAKEYIELKIDECIIEKGGVASLQDIIDYLAEDSSVTYYVALEEVGLVAGEVDIGSPKEIYVVYNRYQFKVDESKKVEFISIVDVDLEGKVSIEAQVKEYLGKNSDGKYEASVLLKATGEAEISKLEIQNPDGTTLTLEPDGLTTVGKDMTIEFDKTYKVILTTTNGHRYTKKIIEKSEETIMNAEQLASFRDKVNSGLTYEGKTVKLGADIDLSTVCGANVGGKEVSWEPIGKYISDTEYNSFNGIFDGNNKAISNLYINTNQNYQGLFGCVKNANIKNIKMENGYVNINSSNGAAIIGLAYNTDVQNCNNKVNFLGNAHIGGIVGHISENSIIKKCSNKGNITGKHSTGGIVGSIGMDGCLVDSCYNIGQIKTTDSGSNNTYYLAGGIVGYKGGVGNATISNCYNTGSVYGHTNTGGIVSYAEGSGNIYLTNNYSIGTLTGNEISGIFNKKSSYRGTPNLIYSNNYWLKGCGATYGYPSSNTNATPVDANILKSYATTLGDAYTNDIQNEDGTWKYNNGYPILKWQLQENQVTE